MSFHKTTGFNPKWAHNQGFINAMVVRLHSQSEERLKEYAATLTDDERNLARSHLITALKIQGARDEKTNDKN